MMLAIDLFLIVAGSLLLPVAVSVMAAAILLPIVERPALDPFWFAVVFGINVEIGLITPPVGLNFCVVKGIVPDVSLPIVFRDELPFILSMVVGVLLLCVFSGLETPC